MFRGKGVVLTWSLLKWMFCCSREWSVSHLTRVGKGRGISLPRSVAEEKKKKRGRYGKVEEVVGDAKPVMKRR